MDGFIKFIIVFSFVAIAIIQQVQIDKLEKVCIGLANVDIKALKANKLMGKRIDIIQNSYESVMGEYIDFMKELRNAKNKKEPTTGK